jgi:hypothetical protein
MTGKSGPGLLEIPIIAVRASDPFLAMLGNGQTLRKRCLAVTAEEFRSGRNLIRPRQSSTCGL